VVSAAIRVVFLHVHVVLEEVLVVFETVHVFFPMVLGDFAADRCFE
jgi:hypothetical protein